MIAVRIIQGVLDIYITLKNENSASTKSRKGNIGEKQLLDEKNRPVQNEQGGCALSNSVAHDGGTS